MDIAQILEYVKLILIFLATMLACILLDRFIKSRRKK